MIIAVIVIYFVFNVLLLCFTYAYDKSNTQTEPDYYWDQNKSTSLNIKSMMKVFGSRFKEPISLLFFGVIIVAYQFIRGK